MGAGQISQPSGTSLHGMPSRHTANPPAPTSCAPSRQKSPAHHRARQSQSVPHFVCPPACRRSCRARPSPPTSLPGPSRLLSSASLSLCGCAQCAPSGPEKGARDGHAVGPRCTAVTGSRHDARCRNDDSRPRPRAAAAARLICGRFLASLSSARVRFRLSSILSVNSCTVAARRNTMEHGQMGTGPPHIA